MKRIVTFDKANQPYGFVQLDDAGNIPGSVTASYAALAEVANSALTASHAIMAETATFATTAGNGSQWETTADGIAYGDGNVTIGLASQPGVHVSKYQPIVGTANNQSEMAALFANSTYDSSFISPNIYNIGLSQDNYALLFEGSITVPTTGTYLFGLASDDASDAFIDNTRIADWYGQHGGNPNNPGGNQYPIHLTAGKHTLVVRFVEFSGNDFVSLLWSQDNGSTWEAVPNSWFTYQTTSLSKLKLNNGAIITGSVDITGSLNVLGTSLVTGSLNINGDVNITNTLNQGSTTILEEPSVNTDNIQYFAGTLGYSGYISITDYQPIISSNVNNMIVGGDWSGLTAPFTIPDLTIGDGSNNVTINTGYYTPVVVSSIIYDGGLDQSTFTFQPPLEQIYYTVTLSQNSAIGSGSHAQGFNTIAVGNWSHAEGNYTIASGSYQTVVGQFNLPNNDSSLFVVGDGTSEGARHDVLRVDAGVVRITGSLNVSGSTILTGSLNVSGSLNATRLNIAELNVSGSTALTGSLNISASAIINVSGSTTITGSLNVSGSTTITGSTALTGSLNISASATINVTGSTTLTGITALNGSGSAPILKIAGSTGEISTVTDNISGSLFTVNSDEDFPCTLLEVLSDGKTMIGSSARAAYAAVANTVSTGIGTVIYQLPTASYDGAWFDYTARSGSVARIGQIMTTWSGSTITFLETTSSIGTTSALTMSMFFTGSYAALSGSTSTTGWTVKTIIKSI